MLDKVNVDQRWKKLEEKHAELADSYEKVRPLYRWIRRYSSNFSNLILLLETDSPTVGRIKEMNFTVALLTL